MSIFKVSTPRVQRVLPLVYDDSLSYYEVLGKFKCKLNEIIDFCNDLIENKIVSYIDSRFNEIFSDVIYDEENETITLKIEESEG